jgi:hypothetical protein
MRQFQQKGSVVLAMLAIILMGHALRANDLAERALGTFILGPTTTQGCPSGFTCNTFTVICPGIAPITGVIADQRPLGQIQGMVMFFSGEAGTT